jgi:hypothetical protein
VQRDENAVELAADEVAEVAVGGIEGMRVDALPQSAASTALPLLSDTGRSAEVPPSITATLPNRLAEFISLTAALQ